MAKRWRILPHDADRIQALQRAAGVPAVVAQLLLCRGISEPQAVRTFLEPKLSALHEPDLLPGCAEAARRIHQAIDAKRRIVIYGDYDVDGMTGTAILYLCLKLLGANVGYHIPHRLDDGYGLSNDSIRRLAVQGAEMIVSVDCGIGSVEEAVTARECKVELIITDHHQPPVELPDAAVVVHPRLSDGDYPFGGLSGSGVALKVAWSVCQQASGARRVSPRMRTFLIQAVGLAALGTVADVVPLVDENRVLVHGGLSSLKSDPTPGLAALMEVAKLNEKPTLAAEDIGFMLAPRLNAAGRLGQPQLAVELLLTERPERARELAEYIDGLNKTRQTLERSINLTAQKQVKADFAPEADSALVLADHGWHAGVIGIVAGRLAEKYHRPVVLISLDPVGVKPGVGSARSIPGFNLHEALEACDEHLLTHGGHAAAAGLTVADDSVDAFRIAFCEHAAGEISEEDRTAELTIDAETPLSAFTLQSVGQIERLAPFGASNPRPLMCAAGVTLAGPPRPMGEGGRHLSMRVKQHNVVLRAVAFGGGEWADELSASDRPIDIAFRPVINTFRGRSSVELHLVDWREA